MNHEENSRRRCLWYNRQIHMNYVKVSLSKYIYQPSPRSSPPWPSLPLTSRARNISTTIGFIHLTYTSCVQWSSIALERKLIYTRALVDKMETTMTPRTISLNMKLHLLDCDVYISKTVVGTQTAFETLCNPLSGFNILWLENLLRSNVSREITPVTSGQTDPDASVITATNKATTSRCPSTFNNDVSPPVRPIAAWLPR